MGFSENEAVIEEEIKNHSNNTGKDEGASSKGKFVRKRDMKGGKNIVGEFIERGQEAK